MQLVKNARTREQLWSRQARLTRWGVTCVFPKPKDGDIIAMAEATYSVNYDAMVTLYDLLGFGQVSSIPDYVEMITGSTTLKYADEHRPFVQGRYSTTTTTATDKRRAMVRMLKLRNTPLPTAIVIERLV